MGGMKRKENPKYNIAHQVGRVAKLMEDASPASYRAYDRGYKAGYLRGLMEAAMLCDEMAAKHMVNAEVIAAEIRALARRKE